VGAQHHKAVIARLRRFREGLEGDAEPERWTLLEGPAVLLLADVCDALALTEEEQAEVLGQDGERTLADTLEARPFRIPTDEPQADALARVREGVHGDG
jgi:hypothetical protein